MCQNTRNNIFFVKIFCGGPTNCFFCWIKLQHCKWFVTESYKHFNSMAFDFCNGLEWIRKSFVVSIKILLYCFLIFTLNSFKIVWNQAVENVTSFSTAMLLSAAQVVVHKKQPSPSPSFSTHLLFLYSALLLPIVKQCKIWSIFCPFISSQDIFSHLPSIEQLVVQAWLSTCVKTLKGTYYAFLSLLTYKWCYKVGLLF